MDRLDCDRMFVAVIEAGSFAGGAQRLGVSAGQASKMVSRLEAELGAQLIRRTTRALSPTEVGRAYHLRIKDLIDELDALDASIRNAAGIPAGRLRLSAPQSFGAICLVPLLLDFSRLFPDIQLDVSFSDRAVSLVDEGFDLAVRIGQTADTSLIARRLTQTRVVTVAAPAYLYLRGRPSAPAELARHDCVIDTNIRDPQRWAYAGDETVAVNGALRFSNGAACLAAAEAGLGVARVPTFIAGPAIREGRVEVLLQSQEPPPRQVQALYPPARHLAGKVRALVDHLVARFHGEPDWESGWPVAEIAP